MFESFKGPDLLLYHDPLAFAYKLNNSLLAVFSNWPVLSSGLVVLRFPCSQGCKKPVAFLLLRHPVTRIPARYSSCQWCVPFHLHGRICGRISCHLVLKVLCVGLPFSIQLALILWERLGRLKKTENKITVPPSSSLNPLVYVSSDFSYLLVSLPESIVSLGVAKW